MANAFAISVVIRTRDSARTLERVISGLCRAADDEVIVVDSGSKDFTLAIARKHGAQVVIAPGPFNYSKSLNLGFAAAKNPWVLVISSHAIPVVPRFLEIYREAIKQFPGDVVVGYAPSTLSGESGVGASAEETRYYTADNFRPIEPLCGNGNAIYRRAVWEKLPFDETIRTAEDKLWLMEVIKQGRRIAYIPAARTSNRNQASLRYMFRKGYSDARARCVKGSGQMITTHCPMRLYDLAGALKKIAVKKLKGEIDLGNWARHSAHAFGQFFGSRGTQNNSPEWKPGAAGSREMPR